MKKVIAIISLLVGYSYAFSQEKGEPLSPWQSGYLDIHHINTGCGECAYIIFPDATTMLIDAGENSSKPERHVPPKPDNSKAPSEWIIDYIRSFAPEENPDLDYVLLTHFHNDHIGGILTDDNFNGSYHLTGITRIAHSIRIHTLVDRGYKILPNKDDKAYLNYLAFVLSNPSGVKQEVFEVGTDKQFIPKRDQALSKNFKISNLYANGWLWDKKKINSLFPDISSLPSYDIPRENTLSCAIKLAYGDFSYYTGGDISGYPRPGRSNFHDIESKLAPVVGNVDVCVVNHHGNNDATNDTFISALQPRFFIIQASDALHPNHTALYRMLSKELYPGKRDVLTTNLHPAAKVVIGDLINKMKSRQGHIVIRVFPKGKEYQVYILDDNSTGRLITKTLGPVNCKSN